MNNCSTQRAANWLAALCFLALAGCHNTSVSSTNSSFPGSSQPGADTTPSRDTQGIPLLPDPSITPGATLAVTKDDICVPGYSGKVRNVPSSVKAQAYDEYHITTHKPGEYEVDHLISLELGGSNSLKNLWPESYKTQPWNAHVKDTLENRLHDDVCTNQIDLPTAQKEIAGNWIAAYKRIFSTDQPLAHGSHRHGSTRKAAYDSAASVEAVQQQSAPGTSLAGQVWVNTKSGKYFRPNTRYYGNTKQGEYLPEAEAIRQGFVAAR